MPRLANRENERIVLIEAKKKKLRRSNFLGDWSATVYTANERALQKKLETPEAEASRVWVCEQAEAAERLLRAIKSRLSEHTPLKPSKFGDLLLLTSPRQESIPIFQGWFHTVIGELPSHQLLPLDELMEVLQQPREVSRNLFIGGAVDLESETLALTRGDLTSIVVPLSLFNETEGRVRPDFTKFSITDHGHTVCFGKYEAAADAILYEADPQFRKALKKSLRSKERGFGASLRRLRIQKQLSQKDFSPLSEKTIGRIERGEIEQPQKKTLSILAKKLGVDPHAIESY